MATELRQKKLASGKEKLAAFRSKKAKALKKLNANSNASFEMDEELRQQVLHDFNSTTNGSEETSPSDSELCSLTSDDEQFDEAAILCSSNTHVPFTLSELENAMDEKHMIKDIMQYGEPSQWADLSRIESALSQRDELLSQLASSLEFFQKHPSQTDDFTTQLCALAQHICTLKAKLNQANEDLQEQLILHESSMISLQAAKAQILQLQMIINKKDEHLNSLSQRVQTDSEALKLKDKSIEHCQLMMQAQSAELDKYRMEMESKMVEIQQWAAANTRWELKEQELLASVCDKSEEILSLEKSLHILKQEKSELHEKYVLLQASSTENNSDSRLHYLEQQLAELRSVHELDLQEMSKLQKRNHDLEVGCDDHLKSLSLYQSLQQDYEHIRTQHSSCLHQLENLNILNTDLQHKLDLLSQAEQDHQALKQHFEELKFNYDCEVRKRSELETKLLDFENSLECKTSLDHTMNDHTPPTTVIFHTTTNSLSEYSIKEVIEADLHNADMMEHNVYSSEQNVIVEQESVKSVPAKMDLVQHNVSSCKQNVSFQQDRVESPILELDSDKQQLLAVIKDLRFKLTSSETVNQQYVERLRLLESVNSSDLTVCSTDLDVVGSNTVELEQLKEKINEMTMKIQTKEMELNKITTELASSKESLLLLENELTLFRHVNSQESSTGANTTQEMEDITCLQLVQQQLHEKEIAQEELQTQLESTITQWQKLQLIVQEKEIDIQNLHENLDEQKRICSSMSKSHQDYVEVLQSEIETLKLRLEEYQETFFNMENEILLLITEKNSVQNEDRKSRGLSHNEMISIEIQTDLNDVDAEIQTNYLDLDIQDIPTEAKLHTALIDAKMQTLSVYAEVGDILNPQRKAVKHSEIYDIPSEDSQSMQLTLSQDSQTESVTMLEELRQNIIQKDILISSLQLALKDKETFIQELETKIRNIENELVTTQDNLKVSLKSSEDNLAVKDGESVTLSKKVSAQQLKLKASKKQISQKEKMIAELTDKLTESNNQISDTNMQISELLNKIVQKDEIIEDLQLKLNKRDQSFESVEVNTNEELPEVQTKSDVEKDVVSNLTEALFKRDTEVARLNTVLIEREKLLSRLNKELSENNDRHIDLLKNANEKDDQLSTASRQLAEKDDQLSTATRQLAEKDDQLSTATRQLAEKDDQLSTATRQLAEKDDQLSTATRQLEKKDDQLSTANNQLAEKDDQLSTANNQLAEKDDQLSTANNQLAEKDDQVSTASRQLAEKDDQVSTATRQHAEKDDQLSTATRQLAENEVSISTLNIRLIEKTEEICCLQKAMTEKEAEICRLKNSLLDINNDLLHLQEKDCGHDAEIRCLQQQLLVKDIEIEKLHQNVIFKEKELSEINELMSEKESFIARTQNGASQEISNLQNSITQKDEELAEYNQKLQDISEEITLLRSLISEKDKENSSLAESLCSRDSEVVRLTDQFKEKDDELSSISKTLIDREEEIVHLQKQLSETKNQEASVTLNLSSQNEEVGRLLVIINQREEQLENLQKALDEKFDHVSELVRTNVERDETITNFLSKLEDKEKECCHLLEISDDKDSLISELNKGLIEKENELRQLSDQLSSHKSTALAKSAELTYINEQLLEKEETIGNLLISVSGKNDLITELNGKLSQITEDFVQLRTVVSEGVENSSALTSSLCEKNSEISKLNIMITEKLEEISKLNIMITEKLEEISNLKDKLFNRDLQYQSILSEKNELETTLNHDLSAKINEIDKLHKDISDKDQQLIDLKKNLSDQIAETLHLQGTVSEKEEEISHLQITLVEKENQHSEMLSAKEADVSSLSRKLTLQWSELNRELLHKDEEMGDLLITLSGQKEALSLLNSKLVASSEEISRLHSVLSERDVHIADLSQRLSDQAGEMNENISASSKKLSENDKVITALEVKVTERDQQIVELNGHLAKVESDSLQLQEKLVEMQEEMSKTQTVTGQIYDEIEMLKKSLAGKDVEIVNLQTVLSEKESELINRSELIAARDVETTTLLGTVSAKEDALLTMKKILNEKEDNIAHIQSVLSDKTLEINSLQESIDNKNSELVALQKDIECRNEENAKLLVVLNEKDESISALQSQLKTMSDVNNETNLLLNSKENEIMRLTAQMTDLGENNSELMKKLSLMEIESITLCHKDEQINVISKQLLEKDEELAAINQLITLKDKDIASLKETILNKNEEAQQLNAHIELKNEEAQQLSAQLELKNEEAQQLSAQLELKNEEAQQLSAQLELKNEEAQQLNAHIELKNEEAQQLSAQLELKNEEAQQLSAQLELKNEEAQQLNTQLKLKNEEAQQLSAQLELKNEEAQQLRAQLELKNEEAQQLSAQLELKNEEAQQLNAQLKLKNEEAQQLSAQLELKNEEAQQLSAQLELKNEEAQQLNAHIELKNEEAQQLSAQLELKNEEAQQLNTQLKLKNEEAQQLSAQLELKNEEAQQLSAQLELKNEEAQQLNAQLELKNEEAQQLSAQLELKNEEVIKLTEITQQHTEHCNGKLLTVQQQLAEKDSVIESITVQVSEVETIYKETAEKLRDRDSELETLKKTLQTKEADTGVIHLKILELDKTNRELNDNIIILRQELDDYVLKLNSKETELSEITQRLLEKEGIISQIEVERENFNQHIVQQDICINGLLDTVTSFESEISQHKQRYHDLVNMMKTEQANLFVQVDNLKGELHKKDFEHGQVEQDRSQMKSQLLDLESEIERLKKELEESNSENKFLEESSNDLSSIKESLLLRLNDMEQKMKEKDLEISAISARLVQEQENCKHLVNSNNKLQKGYIHLQSCSSYLMETSELSQAMLVQQKITLQEQGENLPTHCTHTSEDVPDGNRSSKDVSKSFTEKKLNYQLLLSQLLVMTDDSQNKDGLLLEQNVEMGRMSSLIADLSAKLEETKMTLSEAVQSNSSLRLDIDTLKVQCHTLAEGELVMKQRISLLEAEVESHGLISSHHVTECNRLADNMAQLSQELDANEKLFLAKKLEAESYVKELNDLKAELELRVATERSLKETVDSLTSSLEKSQEERELLKANFDSCMEDMQHKHAQQELDIQNLRSQLAEQTKTVYLGQDQLKDMFELQICQLEEKLLLSEKQGEQLAKELADSKAKYNSCKDLFEGQMSDLEISLQAANSETAKLRDQLSKIMHNHECDIAGLKRLHEIQTSELEDSCLTLERNVSELKRQINEQAAKFKKEKSGLEQSLDFHLSDFEEKRRLHETEISRLKRHLEEMKQDHEMELRNLEKSYEARMYELEDKCCIATNELERLRKFFSSDGEYSEERHMLDLRIDELETKRRDLEIQNMALEDEVKQLREQEEEFKSLLHSMAERQDEKVTETAEEIVSLKHELSELTYEKNQVDLSLQAKKADLERLMKKNEELESRIAELEKLVEQTVMLGMKDEGEGERSNLSNLSDLQRQIDSLSEENRSLKRQLVLHEVPKRSLRLNSGVEAICPPYSHASTEYKSSQNINNECFSPVLDDEVLEGFVAEKYNSNRPDSECNLNNNSRVNQEPDFVAEQNDGFQEPDFVVEQTDRFQPEIDNERLMDERNQLDMHPIWENEGFQPEKSDLFLMETMEEPEQRIDWPNELSVGLSPSQHQISERRFDFNNSGEQSHLSYVKKTEEKILSGEEETGLALDKACKDDENERQINQLKEDLEEQYVMKMRKQESDLMFKYESQCDQYKKEMEQHFAQKIQAVRYEWERKFTKALRKLKKEMEKRSIPEQGHQSRTSDSTDSNCGRMNSKPADIAGRNEELDEVVEKLHKENQELAEVRDDLLRQIEISRARGLHDRVQHELQTMLTTRESHSLPCAPAQTIIPPVVDYEESVTPANKSVVEEGDGSKSEASDSSSVRECFLEELEEISHQSGQDLPLEWELTSTETGAFEQEPASIWEVFDGRCVRQDCREVDSLRIQYEHEVASLQRQLEAERRCDEEQLVQRQEEYSQAMSELRDKLDLELQDSLDQIIEDLSQLHSQEMKQLLASHQDDMSLEITALKISLEQIYTSKAHLEASHQQEIFQQKLAAVERRHKEELNKVKHGIILPEALEHLSETLTDDYNKLIQRISHELEMRFVNETGDSGFGSHTSQELHSLLISQQEEITMLRSKLLAEYGSLIHSRLETMMEHAEEVNKLEDQMKDIKVQCEQQLEHLQENIKSPEEFESKESDEQNKKFQESVDLIKEHYEMVIEKMETDFEAKISALQEKYEEQMAALCLTKIPLTTGIHSDLNSTSINSHLISSRDNSVESGSFSESVEKDMSDQMKKLEAELLERDTFQQKLRNDLVNEELKRKSLEAEVSQLKETIENLKAEYDNTVSRCSSLESLVKEREDRIIQLEYEKMESDKLYRDLLDKESKVSEIKELSNVEDSVEFTTASSSDINNYSPSDNKEVVESLQRLVEDLENQLAAAISKEHDLRNQMEEKEHTYKEILESLKSELDHEKQIEIETLQSEFKVQLAIELKHQAAELTSSSSDADSKEQSLVSAVSMQTPDDVLPSSQQDIHVSNVDSNLMIGGDIMDQDYQTQIDELKQQLEVLEKEKTSQISGYEEKLENLQEQLNESEDRYDRLMQGIESGEHDQLNEMFQDKYDRQLELAKSLMQKDFDEMLHSEKKSLVEKHRKLMIDLMGDRSEEEKTMQENHQVELEQLKQSLSDQFQEERVKYTLEINRLNFELEELKKFTMSNKSDHNDNKNLMLPEIDEIVLSFQEITESPSSSLDGSRGGTSTPVKLNESDDSTSLVQMIEEHHFGADNLMTDIPVKTYAEALKSPIPMLACERQEMMEKIEKLTNQVEYLTQQLEELQRLPLPLSENSLTCSMETIKGDDSALLAMLKSDLDRISVERESIQRTNDRLLSLLSDSVKTYIGVEDTISRRLSQNVFSSLYSCSEGASASAHSPRPGTTGVSHSRESSPDTFRVEKHRDADTSQDSHSVENTSFQSNGIDEGLEISQRLAECIFVGPDLDAEGEEILSDARGRLQTSISQLLELMERSCLQLQEAKSTQNDLLEALSARAREVESLNNKCQELNSQISAEIEAKEYLGLELHKAEGLIAGYISEHDSLESQIQTLEHQRESLILELDTTRSRLEHFEQSQSELDSFRDELNHQQQVLQDNAGQEIQVDESNCMQATGDGSPALLGEITSLNKDKRELANQLQQQLDLTRKRLLELETQSEESDRYHDAALEEKVHEIEDLKLQLENVERQLKSSKAFVDEQLLEREQEREEHQKEIEKLQEILEAKDRQFNSQQRLQLEISDLNEQLQTRMNSQSAMHQHILDLQKALQDKELSTHDLKVWVAQLEKELDQRGDVEEQLKQRISRLEQQLINKKDDSIIDSAESSLRDSMKDRTPPLILSPLQTQKVSSVSLEEELRRCQQFEQELVHENKALKEQVQMQLLQISGLRNQLDELRQYSGMEADTDSSQLRIKLQASRDALEKLEEKLSESQSKIESLEDTLRLKTEESDQIRLKVSRILDMGNAIEENEHLKNQLVDLQNQISHLSSISSLSSLPPELLEEKNSEIHELQDKLTKLEKDLTDAQEQNAVHNEKIFELQVRLKEKDEEINDLQDNIASLRRGEPFLDMSLPMNEDANNLLNISMTGRTSMQQEFEETILNKEAELTTLNEKIIQITKDLERKNEDITNLEETVSKLKAEKEQHASLEEAVEQRDSEIYSLTLNTEEMKQQIQEQVETIQLLEHEIEKWEKKLSDVVEERDKFHSEVTEKDYRLDQMQIQIENYQHEITSLTNFQHELQKDFDTVQSMLDEKEKEVEALIKELTENKSQSETIEALLHLEGVVAALKKELAQKHNVIEEKEEELYELRDKLEEMVETKTEEVASLKQQMTETEDQLRLRQTAVLDLEAEKEKLLLSLEDSKHLEKRLEEKDLIIEELENQLRFRQSRILDMESEKDRLVEEKEALESDLVKKLTEKDVEIEKLESFNQNRNYTDEMEQTTFSFAGELSSACVDKGSKINSTLLNETLTVQQMEEKLYLQLKERDKQIQMLQEEVETLHQDSSNSFSLQLQVKELQDLLQEKEESSDAQAVEYQTVISRLEKEIADLKSAFGDSQRQESRVSRSAHVSLSSSMDDESPSPLGMARWDSEPTELGQGTRFFSLNALEASWRTRQRQRELLEKNSQLENLRQNFEKWLKSKDQILLDPIVKEKEMLIISLRSEIESITEKVMEKELQITNLRDEMNNMRTIHIQEIASKEHKITQLHEEIYLLKSVKSHSHSSDQSLSPETKQSISHLKMQLRKAHAALEEMQGTQLINENVRVSEVENTLKIKLEVEVEKLKEMLKTKEEEYVLLKSTLQIELDDAVKKLEEQQQRLGEQHKQELHDLIMEYEEQIASIKNQKDDNNKETETSNISISDDTMPERLQLLLQQLNELGEHFLSISDFHYLQQYLSPHKQRIDISESFRKQDLKEFDETVDALQNLLTIVKNVNSQATEESQDWRAEILMALGNVYMKEKDLIIAEINEADSICTELDLMARLESKIQHLADIQESSMEVLMLADRKSLMSELNSVKRELSDTKLHLQNIKDDLGQQVSLAEENKSKLEWKLQRQIQMLECKLQQESVIEDDLKKSLKSERQRLSELTLQSTHDKSHLLELQSELSSTQIQLSKARDSLQREQQRFTSITDALEEEKEKNIRLAELLDTTKKTLDSLRAEVTENELEYQRRRESEENYVKELQGELLKERQRSYQFSQAEDEAKRQLAYEREHYKAALDKEKSLSIKLKDDIEIIKSQSQLKQMENKSDQTDGDQSRSTINVRDGTERNVHLHLKVVEEDREKLKIKVNDLEHELGRIQTKMEELETELEKARLVTDNFHHVELQSDEHYLSTADDNLEQRLADCCVKLQSVAHQLDKMTLTSHQPKSTFIQDQNTLVTVMSQLRQLRGEIKERGQAAAESVSNSEQVNRLIEHNKQLAGHINKLKIEKKDLVNSLQDIKSKFQDAKRAQMQLPQYLSDTASEDGGVYDRTVWASERLGLQMALDSAEHEIQRLRTEIHQFRSKIHSETSQADVDKTSRLYGKYLRAESFRKALIYQKKYLLLLLGGYRDTEQETLAILASMGGFAAPYSSSFRRNRSAAFTRFRSAGRVIIAISRMKYMVRKWKRATRVGSPVMAGQISPHTSYVPSSSSYPKHSRHQFVSSDQLVSRNVHLSETYVRNGDNYLLANGDISAATSRTHNHITTPPTKDLSPLHRQSKPLGKEKIRRDIFAGEHSSPSHRVYNGGGHDHQADDADDFLRYLQNIHKQLSEGDYGAGREVL